jgi:DNA-binding winged helix-turn-helix (wHTH) protein/Tol biopolymer transport system component
MVQLYQVANYVVDVARNQIIRDQHSVDEVIQTLPPKTIMVLTELVKSQGQVVSHDQLMNVVWQNTVVSPNSIQRCITQLRKALADDSKKQLIIKTHARQGYSLEVAVKVLPESNESSIPDLAKQLDSINKNDINSNKIPSIDKNHKSDSVQYVAFPEKSVNFTKRIVALICLCILAMVLYLYFSTTPRNFNFNALTPITSSDNLERNASYSPDGKYILFHRYDGLCDNNIWAKELATGKAHKLTTTYGFYSDHSFTENGDKLAFMAKVSCVKNKSDKKEKNENIKKACWNLMTLDFKKALKQSQEPDLIVSCDQGALSHPVWLNNGNIVALNKQDSRWQIVKFMPKAPSYVPLSDSNDKNYYHLMYSNKKETLIALAINTLNQHVIDLISPQGELLSSNLIGRPYNISPHQLLEPIIDPQQDKLLFTTGKRLYSLSFSGEIEQITTLSHNNLSTIKMNVSGDDIVTVQGFIDTDIAKVNTDNFDPILALSSVQIQGVKFNEVRQPYPSIARSIVEDYEAQFQPKGELIAFISMRSGTSQIWIQSQNQLTQLTYFPIDTIVSSFSWAPSGSYIMLSANSELYKVSLDKSIKKIPLKLAVLNLYQWQDNNELLIHVRQAGQPQLISYNVISNETTILIKDEITWAYKTELNQLLYLDDDYIFWIKTGIKIQIIEKLKAQFGSKRFVFENGKVYGINKNKQFWSYTLNTDTFKILGSTDSYTNFISDLRGKNLLLTQIISAKKEVVVLSNKGN